MNARMQRLIAVCNELASDGRSGGSTGEIIAAAFVLNDMTLLPAGYQVAEAWERLGDEWQGYVMQINQDYRHLVQSP
jgi:hypothetical protein